MLRSHFCKAGLIEVWRGRGYKWIQGYSWVNPETGNMTQPWCSRREACAEAWQEGERTATFHETLDAAQAALKVTPSRGLGNNNNNKGKP